MKQNNIYLLFEEFTRKTLKEVVREGNGLEEEVSSWLKIDNFEILLPNNTTDWNIKW